MILIIKLHRWKVQIQFFLKPNYLELILYTDIVIKLFSNHAILTCKYVLLIFE